MRSATRSSSSCARGGRGAGAALQVDSEAAAVCQVRDGKLASFRIEPDREAALRSVGLR